jgi:alpha-beta hydrolase superfamily lysophospholipase
MSSPADALVTSDGLHLHGHAWPAPVPRGALAIVHGLGEHAGRYGALAAAANRRGLSVVSADLRGHGRSPGAECAIRRFDEYVRDAEAILVDARRRAPRLPLFLMGHSLGGAVALRLLSESMRWRDELSGIVLSSAALRIGSTVSPVLLRLVHGVAAIAPQLRLQAVDPALVSRDPAAVAAYAQDPLVSHRAVPARTASEIVKAIAANAAAPAQLKLPLLVFHGGADRLTDPEGSRQLFAAWAGADKTLRLWQDNYHETLNDFDATAVRSELLDWIGARCPDSSAAARETARQARHA